MKGVRKMESCKDYKEMYQKLVSVVKDSFTAAEMEKIDKAFHIAEEAHGDQKRRSGEPYIVHPIYVAKILADMGMDADSVCAALLHDVVEDTDITAEYVRKTFGEDVEILVDGVTKLGQIPLTKDGEEEMSKEEAQSENIRKMFLAMSKDIRVIIIKLADRVHNMRTLSFMPEEKRRYKARETLEIYAPLAHRLGIRAFKEELEDLAISFLDPVAYNEIASTLEKQVESRQAFLDNIKVEILERVKKEVPNVHLAGRIKSVHGIYRKTYMQNRTIDEIYDIYAVRLIVDSVYECYCCLGVIHDMFSPIPGRFKDYISTPKPNMYQSLHTTVIGKAGVPFEVQIRTWEMHNVAEQGVAAHWKYKEGISGTTDQDEKLAWVRQLLEVQSEATDSEDFLQTFKIDLFADEVFIFTPRGDVVSLPSGATPIDFAFAIHSAVGYKMIGAKANSRIVPLDYCLKNGDIVEIITTSAVKGPSRDWLNLVKTAQARSKINAWFKKENRENNVERGKEAVEREIKKLNLNPSTLLQNEYVNPMLKRYGFKLLDDAYAAVGYGGITASKLALRLKEYASVDAEVEDVIPVAEAKKPTKNNNGIEVEGIDNCLVRLSKCCNPIPGDAIIGFITRGRGVSVHRASCVNVREENLDEESKARRIRCMWQDVLRGTYNAELSIECADRKGILAEIAAVVSDSSINIVTATSRSDKAKGAVITLQIEVSDRKEVDHLVKRLYRIPNILDIRS